jgi:hypothetical protein
VFAVVYDDIDQLLSDHDLELDDDDVDDDVHEHPHDDDYLHEHTNEHCNLDNQLG